MISTRPKGDNYTILPQLLMVIIANIVHSIALFMFLYRLFRTHSRFYLTLAAGTLCPLLSNSYAFVSLTAWKENPALDMAMLVFDSVSYVIWFVCVVQAIRLLAASSSAPQKTVTAIDVTAVLGLVARVASLVVYCIGTGYAAGNKVLTAIAIYIHSIATAALVCRWTSIAFIVVLLVLIVRLYTSMDFAMHTKHKQLFFVGWMLLGLGLQFLDNSVCTFLGLPLFYIAALWPQALVGLGDPPQVPDEIKETV